MRSQVIHHNGKDYISEPATITYTSLGNLDLYGVFISRIGLEWGGKGTGIGNRVMDTTPPEGDTDGRRVGTAYGMQLIMDIMVTAGVSNWEDLKGQHVLALFKEEDTYRNYPVGFAGFEINKALVFDDHLEQYNKASAFQAS